MSKPWFTKYQQQAINAACDDAITAAETALERFRQVRPALRDKAVLNQITYWRNVRSAAKWIKHCSKRKRKGTRKDAKRGIVTDQGSAATRDAAPAGK